MKTSNIVLLGVGGYLVIRYFGNLGVAVNTISFILKTVNIKAVNNIQVILTVQNVSNANLTINSMAGDIMLNGEQFASISDFTQRMVPGNSAIDIPINVRPNYSNLPSYITSMLNGQKNFDFTIQGNANVNGLVFPFSLTQSY
jgi:LEA14-like dessication related protein